MALLCAVLLLCFMTAANESCAQSPPSPLDPQRSQGHLPPEQTEALAESYIWTAGDVTMLRPDHNKFPWNRPELRASPHYFIAHFQVKSIPQSGTVYVAGPRWARIYLNGTLLGEYATDVDQPINFRVFHADATSALHAGDNVLAIEAIRGRGVVSGAGSEATHQLAYGEVLAAKLLAGPFGDEDAAPLVISGSDWRSTATPPMGNWQGASFDDSAWPHVQALGGVESNIDFFQWSADAGMYGWPGYRGMSSFLRSFSLPPAKITHVFPATDTFQGLQALTSGGSRAPFAVTRHDATPTDAEAPSLLLDFGREIAGRIVFVSDAAQESVVSVAYGESDIEAMATGITGGQRGGNYLGTNLIDVPAHGTARGPKSAFRYVRVRFLRGAPLLSFRSIHAEVIEYPVRYEGSFKSSDPLLNRIWETSAYTAHLCMQDDIWDAPKRDRGRWAGDLDVESKTILTTFGDTFLLEDTLRRLAEETGPGQPVDGIAGYTAQWITTLATLYEQSNDQAFLLTQHGALLRFLQTMDADLDPNTGLLKNSARGWGFVDWSPGLYGATEQTRLGTMLEFIEAYAAAPALLRAMGDAAQADDCERRATRLREAVREAIAAGTVKLGDSWQLNALAILAKLSSAIDAHAAQNVFSHVKQDAPSDPVISPYFNAYLIDAMARTGKTQQALDWIRSYWGGMLAEGATSFWEAYDLRWPKTDYHLSLQADGTSGYFVSLAHGWSSGPAPWLLANVLGVTPSEAGYVGVVIRPQLLGLKFARGSVATPFGPIAVSIDASKGIVLDLPEGVDRANVFPIRADGTPVTEPITLTHPGHYMFPIH